MNGTGNGRSARLPVWIELVWLLGTLASFAGKCSSYYVASRVANMSLITPEECGTESHASPPWDDSGGWLTRKWAGVLAQSSRRETTGKVPALLWSSRGAADDREPCGVTDEREAETVLL